MMRKYIAIIWPTGYEYRDDMWDYYMQYNRVVKISPLITKEFATKDKFMEFIFKVYEGDNLSREILEYKTRLMLQMKRMSCSFFTFMYDSSVNEMETDQEVLDIKTRLRGIIAKRMDNYYYDILLHVTDTKDEYDTIKQVLLNEGINI